MLHGEPTGIERLEFCTTDQQLLAIPNPRDGTIVEIEVDVSVFGTPVTRWRVNGNAVKGGQGRYAKAAGLLITASLQSAAKAQGSMGVRMLACERRVK